MVVQMRVEKNVMRHLTKQGCLDKDGEVVQNPMMDELFQENEAITAAAYASIAGKIAFGKNAGKYRVCRAGEGEPESAAGLIISKRYHLQKESAATALMGSACTAILRQIPTPETVWKS